MANKIKLSIQPSNCDLLINKSNKLLIESNKKNTLLTSQTNNPEAIFIVGMPRSGSTLLESILSMNEEAIDLGETEIFERSFIKWDQSKRTNKDLNLADLYWNQLRKKYSNFNITTNKFLYNYQYAGIIAREIPNAKIIHCYRNPLDNILSIYRAKFSKGNEFSSCLVDCVKVYLNHDEIMEKYKKDYNSSIYSLDYDLLVTNPNEEIKSLINWLGWQWNDIYLNPHLNKRSVSTASSVQVRSPINSKSVGGWRNYENMLSPAIELLTKIKKYKNLKSKL